jgi:hypothetical protein
MVTAAEHVGEFIPEPSISASTTLGSGWRPAKNFSKEWQARYAQLVLSGQKPLTRRDAIDRVVAIANGIVTPTQIFELATGVPMAEDSVKNSIDRDSQYLLAGVEQIKIDLERQFRILAEGPPAARLRIRKAAKSLVGRIILIPTFGNAIEESLEGEPFVVPADVGAACDYVVALLASGANSKFWSVGRCQHCQVFFVSDNRRARAGKRRQRYCTPNHMYAHHAKGAAERKRKSRAKVAAKTRKVK